jgi:pilus assembly protein CpaC
VNKPLLTAFGLAVWTLAVCVGLSADQLSPAASQSQSEEPSFERITLTAGRSRVLLTGFDVTRIAVTNPAIADAVTVARREILIDSKAPGMTSLILWGSQERVQYDVVVEAGTLPLHQQIGMLFPGENIQVSATNEAIVLSGRASTNEIAVKVEEIAQASSSKQKIINLLQRPGAADSQQVMLEVRVAEVEHNALMELGASFLANRGNFQTGATTQQFRSPSIDEAVPGQLGAGTLGVPGGQVIQVSDYLNLFFFLRRDGLLAMLRALQQRGKFQSLAEPNLIAYNGQEASFLAGGEFPVPIVQGNTGQVTIQFREFGVRLTFRPVITGDLIRLRVRPEVSTLDFANGLVLAGFRVPALKTRRAETDVELRDGQSFAIAGLLDNQSFDSRQSIPFLSSLPIIGNLFKSKAESTTRTELLVLITPHLVRPLEPAEVPPLPVDPKSFANPQSGIGGMLEGGGGLVDGPAATPAQPKP